jgi:hypothetical protein
MVSVASKWTLDEAREVIAGRLQARDLEMMDAVIVLLTLVYQFNPTDLEAIMHEEVVKLDHAGQVYWLGERCTCGNPALHGE